MYIQHLSIHKPPSLSLSLTLSHSPSLSLYIYIYIYMCVCVYIITSAYIIYGKGIKILYIVMNIHMHSSE